MAYIKILYDSYDSNGFDRNGLHTNTKTIYDFNGFDKNGLDKNGFDKNGRDIMAKKNQVELKLAKQNLLKIKKEKDMSIYLLLYLKYILIIVQKN